MHTYIHMTCEGLQQPSFYNPCISCRTPATRQREIAIVLAAAFGLRPTLRGVTRTVASVLPSPSPNARPPGPWPRADTHSRSRSRRASSSRRIPSCRARGSSRTSCWCRPAVGTTRIRGCSNTSRPCTARSRGQGRPTHSRKSTLRPSGAGGMGVQGGGRAVRGHSVRRERLRATRGSWVGEWGPGRKTPGRWGRWAAAAHTSAAWHCEASEAARRGARVRRSRLHSLLPSPALALPSGHGRHGKVEWVALAVYGWYSYCLQRSQCGPPVPGPQAAGFEGGGMLWSEVVASVFGGVSRRLGAAA